MTSHSKGAVAASLSGVTRRFGAVTALDGVDFELRRGEIHALIGENGAGKSTVARILAGLDAPNEGSVTIGGAPFEHADRHEAIRRGVGLVQQHFSLISTFTAEENIALSRPTTSMRPSRRALVKRLEVLSDRYGLAVRPRIPVNQLSVGERQRIEILRALDADADILLLDEPTAVLVDAESDRLLALCRELADEGRAVLIVTHRLSEVLAAADRVTVLRGGRLVLTSGQPDEFTRADLIRAMVGSATDNAVVKTPRDLTGAEPALTVDRVELGQLSSCSFAVRRGEIVGIAGVDGNGQLELEALLAGLAKPAGGTIDWHGRRVRPGHPRDLPTSRVAHIASDRHHYALAMDLPLADNLELGRGPVWRRRRPDRRKWAGELLSEWDVRGGQPHVKAGRLSGGNAQKVVLARELWNEPEVVIAAYPTRGLDPNAARSIADRLLEAVDQREAAVVWFGAELDELLAVSDRIVVLVSGHRSVEFTAPFDRDRIGTAMAGLSSSERADVD